ncbi:GNAT family N-acetyltransferase [Alteromonas lipolytica]|uniref:GNAT family N-acetyltransferase n=1 Tax=Alteromonas lipolytica TaxID=1856405 RepID=A0A1E8FFF3_9ALTE|nr:N-acetyltransferase [Alteromonas lipolytica]OFI34665.1 GNAT family N-acetyltransferase [Alteromonas lipolytica]GGF53010.1 N-acetyltransferase [Alteromonas lipolytica]
MSIQIRPEQPDDIPQIHELTVAAFRTAPHSDHNEQFIIEALRSASALSISLVAEDKSRLVGHVAVSPVEITNGAGEWFGLGPVSVSPERQSSGIGSALMVAAIETLKQMGANGCVVLGDPGFYQRFGFAPKDGLILPGVPAAYFQALVFKGNAPEGKVSYHEAFLPTRG